MKPILTLFFILLIAHFYASAQNMVQNGGFEQYSPCPNTLSQISHAVNWDQPSNGTSDYFNTCANPNATIGIPQNFAGYQYPFEGNAYIGFYNYGGGGYREYGRGVVTPLVVGQTYQVTVWVVKCNTQTTSSDGFSVFFYQNGIGAPTNVTTAIAVTPQIDYGPTYGVITDTLNWTMLTDTFTADSAYSHVIIGNFRDDAHTNYSGQQGNYAYYYLDSIDVVPISFIATPSHTDVNCNGGNDGTASVTPVNGTPPYSYLWLPGNQTTQSVSGLTAGSYTVRVVDATQDTVRDTIVIAEPPALAATTSQTNVNCNGGNDGTATVNVSGGSPGYTYSWTPTGGNNSTATNLPAGNYTCTITDAHNCTLQKTFTLTQAGAMTATTSQVNILCNGASTGSASVNVSGGTVPYSYAWTPTGGNNATANNLAAGSYTCTITDAHNCNLQKTFTLTAPTPITATTTQTNVSCNGAGDGTASVTASGGVAPYTYSWSPSGGTAASATGLAPATYTCTITDANNCTLQKTFTITQPAV
ncbi:MAG: SprB repeat-containing protein, partial [Bacteroidetes bacterium]|nr:SprB repeat-containing protein [Bacteroidota bacterium]